MDVMEIDGRVKWFDAGRGFGFVEPDDTRKSDVMLHVSTLRRSGYATITRNARIRVKAMEKPTGLSACHIISMDVTERHVAGSDWECVEVRWFNRTRGFGFLTRGIGTEDIFVHMETVRDCNFVALVPGQMVQCRWARGDKGIAAVELAPMP